jgi:hypothetical protein
LQRIDIQRIWKLAGNGAARFLQRQGINLDTLPDECPFSLEELLVTDFDPVAAAKRIALAMNAPGKSKL